MNKDKILFICKAGANRSKTASDMMNELGYNTDYTGLSYADEKLPDAMIVIFMEANHILYVEKYYRDLLKNKKVYCLNIPDIFDYGELKLKKLIMKKLSKCGLL
jgi:predicted protein tyrosine phosphatase